MQNQTDTYGSFTRLISDADFALSQSVYHNIINSSFL
jgi:hypothetical protein